MGHIFLSYSRKDTAIMQQVRDDLRARGLAVWTDENLKPGTPSWKRAIEAAIEDSDAMVVILSPDSKKSPWVGSEIDYAMAYNVHIIPALARGDERDSVPFALISNQRVDIGTDYSSGVQKLIEAIVEHMNTDLPSADDEGQPWPSTHVEQPYSISLEEAYTGTTAYVKGKIGFIKVAIPAGVDGGAKIHVPGAIQSSDFWLVIQIEPHPNFQRTGDDLSTRLWVPEDIAHQGGVVDVPTINGTVKLTIPAGTTSGQKFRLREKGMPVIHADGQYGDLYVHIATGKVNLDDWMPRM
jgi:hypothetical protein